MLFREKFFGALVFFLPVTANSIGIALSGNTCDGVVLSKTQIATAGEYFESTQDCTAGVSVSGIGSTVEWTLFAAISNANSGVPVSVSINSGAFQFLNSVSEITLSTGTGPTVSPLPVTVRVNQIDADDGSGSIINNASIDYRVVVN